MFVLRSAACYIVSNHSHYLVSSRKNDTSSFVLMISSNITRVSASSSSTATATTDSCSKGSRYTIKAGDTCNSIASTQGTATWWLLLDNQLQSHCANFPQNGSVCMEHPCKTQEVKPGDSCRSVAAANNITVTQLQTWNPWINSGCYNFNNTIGTHICVNQPGEKYIAPMDPIGAPSAATSAVPIPSDIAANTTKSCGLYYSIKAGDYCEQVVLKFGITIPDFLILNRNVNAK